MTELKFEPLDGAEQLTPPKELKFEPFEKEEGFFEKLIGDRLAEQKAADAVTTLVHPSLSKYNSVLAGKQMPTDVPEAPQLDMARKRKVTSVDNLQATPEAFTKGQELKEDTNAHGLDYAANLVQRGAAKAYLGAKKAYAGMNQFAYDTLGVDMPSNKQRLEDIRLQEQGIGEAKSKPAQLVEGALSSIGQQLPGMLGGVVTGSEPLVLGHMFAQTFGQNYDEGKKLGLDYRDNTVRSGLLSSFEVVGEKAGLSDKFKLFKASVNDVPTSELTAHLANFIKKNVPGELATFAGQYATDAAYGVQKPSWESFLNGAADTVLATLTQDAIMGGTTIGAHAALKAALPPAVGNITPISAGPTNAQLDEIAKNLNIPEDKYEEFRNNVRNEIDRRKQQEYEKAQTGEPTVISPIKNSGQVQPPKFDSQVQEKLLQEGNIEEQAPVPFEQYKQMGLDLNKHILNDDDSGEFFTMNPEQQARLNEDVNRLIKRGIEPERALAIAHNRMLPELRQQEQEKQDVTTGNVAPAAGASVPTPNGTVTTPSSPPGVAGAESNGMVPNQQNAAVPSGGTGQQPPAVVQPENNAPTPTVNAPVPQQNKPAIEPLPKEDFDEQVAYFREVLRFYEHLEHGQMTPGQQQQFKNINAEILRLGLNQGLTRAEIHDLFYGKPEQKQANTWEIAKEEPASTATPTPTKAVQEQTAPAAVKEIPPRDMEKPIETTEGLVEPKDLYDANEFSDQLDPVLHAHVADSAAAVDKAQADPVKAAREERDAARAHAGNIRALFRQPDIENQVTQEQLDEAEKDLANAQAKLEEVEAKTEEIKAIQKQANRQRSEGGGRKKQQLTPEQQENKKRQKEIAKIREAAAQRARTAVANATEDLAEGHEPLTDEEMADPIDQKVHEQYKEGLINDAVLALQHIIDNKLLNGTAIQNKAKSLLAEYSITKKDVQAIRDKKANAAQALVDLTVDQLTRRDDLFKGQQNYRSLINLNSRSARPNMVLGKAILDFNNNRTAGSAINTIMKHGNPIERFFANHVRGFVKDVKFVVLEQGDEIPSELQKYKEQWDDARGLFLPKSRIIFIKGSSFGIGRGNDISTVLHELMHAAGMERMHVGVRSFNKNTNLSLAVADLAAIRNRVRAVYDDMVKKGTMPASIKSMVDAVPNLLHDDVIGKTEAERIELLTEALDEFLAYSLSQPEMQALLMMIPSDPKHFFENAMSRFVRDFMNLLSIPTDRFSAFTDVVLVTDRILNSRYSKSEINHVLDYRSAMGASKVGGPPSKEQYIEIIKNKIGLLGAVTDEQKIAYLENEKKILDAELAKGDNGKYGKDWAQSRNGFYGFNMGKAREESALIRSDYVKNTKAHYDDVIAHLRKETPRSAVSRDDQTVDMFGNDSTDEATQIRQRVKEKSAEIEARNAKFAARLEAHNKKPQSYLEKRMAARAAEAKAKLPPWHEVEQEAIKTANTAFKDIDVNGFTPNTINNYHQALTDFSTKNNLDFIDVGLETFDYKLYDLLEEDVKKRARDAAETAFDQRDSDLYTNTRSLTDSLELAGYSQRDNLGDTLVELGYRNYKYYDKLTNIADKAFDAEFENQKKKLPEPSTEIKPRSAKANKANENITRGLTAAKISKLGPQLNNNVKSLQEARDPRNFAEQAGSIVSRPIKNLIAFTWDVDALGRNGKDLGLPALQTVYENMQLMSGTTSKKLLAVGEEVKALQNFYWDHPEKKEKFEELVNASTFDRYDPSNPKGKYNPAYDAMYKELGDAGQKAYKRLKEFYRDLNDEKQQLLKEQIDKLDLLPEERKKVAAALREAYEGSDKIDPYFPLMRFGDFVLELGKGSKKISYRFESEHQRDRAAAILANKVNKSIEQLEQDGDMLRKEDLNGNQMRGDIMNTSKMLKAINEAVNNTPNLSNLKSRNEVMDRIYQTYISFMPEASVRKQFMHRLDIPGFSDDLVRVLSATGARSATQIARLQHGQDLRNSLKIAENQLVGNPGATPYYNKMAGYVDHVLSPPGISPEMKIIDKASSIGAAVTHFHNMTSYASALIQPVDIFARAYPIMGAQLGYGNVGSEMMRMMNITSKYGTIQQIPGGGTRWVMPSVSHAKGLTPDERYFLKVMDDSDVVRKTMTSVAYEGARGNYITSPSIRKFLDSKSVDKAKPIIDKLVMGGLMGDMERLSREFSYMAAANAAMKNLNKKYPTMDIKRKRDMAAKQAVDLTFQAFGNYAPYNKPGFFRHPLTRAILIFKFYPYIMYKTLLGNLYKSLPLAKNKEGKAAAIKTVMGITGIHFLLGGLNATPGFSLAMAAASLLFKLFGKDPDAPDDMKDIDFETWFRTVYLPEHFGVVDIPGLGEVKGLDKFLEYGLGGASFSSRISINNMLSFGDKPNETLMQMALDAFGAIPNTFKSYYDGGHALINGDYEKGFEKLMPGSIASLSAANRIINEGLRTSNGDQIEGYEAGKIPTSTIVGQALGFRPGEVINQQNKDFKLLNAQRVVQLERTQLSKELTDHFVKSFDLEKGSKYTERHDKMFEETLEKMSQFNNKYPEFAFDRPENIDEINNILNSALNDKYNREMNAGVKLTDQNVRLVGPSADYIKEQQKK